MCQKSDVGKANPNKVRGKKKGDKKSLAKCDLTMERKYTKAKGERESGKKSGCREGDDEILPWDLKLRRFI